MKSFFISIMNDRLLVMSNPSKMTGNWPNLYDRSKMEQLVERRIDWSEMSPAVDMTEIMDQPMAAVTFGLFEDLYIEAETEPEYTESELVEIALSIYGGPVGIS